MPKSGLSAHCGSYVQIGVEPEDGRKAHHWRMRARAQPSLSEFSESYTVCCTLSHLSQVKLSIINHLSAYAKDTRVFGFVGLPYVRDGRVCRSQKQIRDKPELSSTTVMMLTSAAPWRRGTLARTRNFRISQQANPPGATLGRDQPDSPEGATVGASTDHETHSARGSKPSTNSFGGT